MLRLAAVTWRYAGATHPSLRDVSVEVARGEVVAVLGASETGKSTLCLVAGGLAPRVVRGRLDGSLAIDGQDVSAWPMHRLAAIVASGFQRPADQITTIRDTVYEEVAFGPLELGLAREDVVDRVEAALGDLHIGELERRDPRRLSGGEQQLVTLAGLLAMRPRYMVLDEPTAELDPSGARLVFDALSGLASAGVGILVSGHATDELARVADRAIVLDRGAVALAGSAVGVMADPRLPELGVDPPDRVRVGRLAAEAGLDPSVLGRAS